MQIQVIASDANNILCQVTPPAVQTITIDRGVAGNGIVSIVPVTIATFQYLRITYTNGTVSDVGPLTSTAYTATAPISIVGNTISLLTVPIATGGTGATTAAAAIQNLLPSYTGNGNKRLGLNSGATALEWVADGGGTVTSVDFSGGTTGLTATGGPITTSGTFTLAGTLAIANGGSGATTAQTAMNAFAGAVTAGSYLRGDGTNVVMSGIQAADVPMLNQDTTGTAANVTGIVAIANGGTGQTTANAAFNALVPAQTGNSGKYLTTDGTNTSWAINPLGTVTSVSGAGTVSGLTLTGTVTTSGSLTLGGTLDLSAYNGAGAFTTLSASGAVTLSSGTTNGVAYLNGSKVLTTGSALTFDGTTLTSGAHALSGGNLSFTSTGQRITGDFSNATPASRVLFQTSTANGDTNLGVIPNGTSTTTRVALNNSTDPNNTSLLNLVINSSAVVINSAALGTGTYLPMTFFTGGSERVRVDTSGNVGIGTSSPTNAFELRGDGKRSVAQGSTSAGLAIVEAQAFNYWSGAGGPSYTGTSINQHGSTATGTTAGLSNASLGAVAFQNGSAGLVYTNGGAPLVFGTAATERMRIDASGNVGIGTSSPATRLQVNAAAPAIRIQETTTGGDKRLELGVTSGGLAYIGANQSAQDLAFQTTGSERARITASGDLLVGTTTAEGRLTVSGNGVFRSYSGPDYQFAVLSPSGADRQVFQAGVLGISNGLTVRYVSGAMQYILTGLGTGTVSSSGGVLSASSDQNMKVADGEVTSAIEKVQQLQPRYFYWKDASGNANEDAGRQLGFFAQEVNAVLPEAAPEPKGKEEGWGVYDRSIVATLTAAIQEQQAIIAALTARIAALESN